MKRFAFDLGTNSLGWAVLDVSDSKKPQIIDMGVRIFSDGREAKTGTPLNEARRTARQMRRQRDRKIRRKKAMLNFLTTNTLMPADKEKRQAVARLDPYELRAAALQRKLEPQELGRIMMQFSIRRGFKSGRKDQQAENKTEGAGMLGGIETLAADLHGLTLGQWLYKQREASIPIRFKPRIEKAKALYSCYPSRQMYESEFAAIREHQEKHYKKINWDRLHWLIFFQRPLKRPERGHCQFYPEEERGYRAFPSAHRFRIMQDIGNLRYFNEKGIEEPIPLELKRKLFDALDSKKSLSFDAIRRLFGENYTGKFNLEDAKRDKLKGNETSTDFRKSEYFGEVWNKLDIRKQDKIVEQLMLEDDESVIFTFLKPFELSDEQLQKISGYNLPVGTTMLSSRFMAECSRIMIEEKLPYHDAVEMMGLHHSKKEQRELQRSLPYYGKVLTTLVSGAGGESNYDNDGKKYGRIANPTVHIALNQLRKLVNALIRRFGNPDQIIMEINRELKQSKAKKDEITREQAKNQKDNERIKAELTGLGLISVNNEYVKKYRLWEELAVEGLARLCPYCGKTISAKHLVSGFVEIDHILPYSRTLLNSRDNLIVAHTECNRAKKNRTPFEAFRNSPGSFDWERILEVTAKLPFKKRRKFSPDAMASFEKDNGFITRQVTDTAYLAKAGKDYLSAICPANSIWVTPGRLTGMLRGFWGYNTLLNRGGKEDSWFKNRSDHRHHALDALVIGLCDRALLAEEARVNSGRGYAEIRAPEPLIKRGEIEAKLKEIIVSHKSDHGKEGKLYAETAMAKRPYLEKISPDTLADEKEIKRIVPKAIQEDIAQLVEKEGFKKAKSLLKPKYEYLRVFRDKWVTRTPLDSLSERDIPNIADETIRRQVQQFLDANPLQSGQKLQDILVKFSSETGIHSVRYFPKDQVPLSINSCDNKAYMPGDFYRVDVWKVPVAKDKYKFEGVFISRPEVMMKKLQKRHEHPTAKLVMRLCKNDVILLSSGKTQEFCRVAGFATTRNKIDIRPLYASDSIAEWKKNTNIRLTSDYWPSDIEGQYFKSINVIFTEFEVKLIKITVDGRVIVRN